MGGRAMTNEQTRELCLALMRSDSEEELIDLLRGAGFWDDARCWRYYGDYENNYNIIGNQQSSPDAALIEKLINAIDARLVNECLVRGIDPEGNDAPLTFEEAIAIFFPENPPSGQPGAEGVGAECGVTLTATGPTAKDRNPCFTIADCGEGQTPELMPATLLSLTRANRLRIPFVQGKFNMGGTGVLKFCGRRGLQLVVSRRNPAIVRHQRHPTNLSDDQWGFTVVRREDPVGGRRSSVYTYLAPLLVDAAPDGGGVLRFSADAMPLFPQSRHPYRREAGWGTLVKLYDYAAVGFRSNILLPDGLLTRANLLLPSVNIPVRLHECRAFRGYTGPWESMLSGLSIWRGGPGSGPSSCEDLELSSSSTLSVSGEPMTATIFAFKRGWASAYRRNEGILFTVNGQTQGYLGEEFFSRAAAGNLGYIQGDLLVVVDCSNFSGRAREDLFMSSRDRLSKSELRNEIERALEDLLRNHEELRSLKEHRRREEISTALGGSAHLKNAIEVLLRHAPALSQLFLKGGEIEMPHRKSLHAGEKPFAGNAYPTFFRLASEDSGIVSPQLVAVNDSVSIAFHTDAGDDYFDRRFGRGMFSLFRVENDSRLPVPSYGLHVHNGTARLHSRLPEDCKAGDVLHFSAVVTGPGQSEPLESDFAVRVKCAEKAEIPKPEERHPARGISLPPIEEVTRERWALRVPPFDPYTALRVVNAGLAGEGEDRREVYDFYVNMDNVYLARELRAADQDPEVTRAQFELGLILLALALLHEDAEAKKLGAETGEAEGRGLDIGAKIDYYSRAIAPFLVPIVRSLAALAVDESSPVRGSLEHLMSSSGE